MRAADTSQWNLFGLLLSILFSLAASLPFNESLGEFFEDDPSIFSDNIAPRQEKWTLRIMPIGASITAGHGSSPEDGYRKSLRNMLRFTGHPVNMVGSQ